MTALPNTLTDWLLLVAVTLIPVGVDRLLSMIGA